MKKLALAEVLPEMEFSQPLTLDLCGANASHPEPFDDTFRRYLEKCNRVRLYSYAMQIEALDFLGLFNTTAKVEILVNPRLFAREDFQELLKKGRRSKGRVSVKAASIPLDVPTLHQKVAIFSLPDEREVCILGSSNYTARGIGGTNRANGELNISFVDKCRYVSSLFQRAWDKGISNPEEDAFSTRIVLQETYSDIYEPGLFPYQERAIASARPEMTSF